MYSEKDLAAEVMVQVFKYPRSQASDRTTQKNKIIIGESKEEAKKIAKELRDEIRDRFLAAQTYPYVVDRVVPTGSGAYVRVNVVKEKNNEYVVKIIYPPKFLRRVSLVNRKTNKPVSTPLQDVFAMFTQGYKTEKRAYGCWMNETIGGEKSIRGFSTVIATPQVWDPNSFISDTIEKYKKQYPSIIKVHYPDEWQS